MTDTRSAADLRSFVDVPADHGFGIQNLPFGVVRVDGGAPRVASRIGDLAVDLAALEEAGLIKVPGAVGQLFSFDRLNPFLAAGRDAWRSVRRQLQELLLADEARLRDSDLRDKVLIPLDRVEAVLPATIGDYTDFYASKEHATNVGTMFRGADNALMPNWTWIPIGYHGRASSVVPSGTDVRRPVGQQAPGEGDDRPGFGPSKLLDFELEMGFVIGTGNPLGHSVPIDEAEDHVFGLTLVNDWSARDIQKWEYQPLGPFLGKSFATSISPWITTLDALAPFRVPGPEQDPEPLDYLRNGGPGAYDVHLEIDLAPEGGEPTTIARTNFRLMYWTIAQMVTHHTVNGCNLRPGDLLASGTISGEAKDSRGSMLELSWRGTEPVELANGDTRKFLQDGDTVTMRGWAQGDGYRIALAEVTGKVLPAHG